MGQILEVLKPSFKRANLLLVTCLASMFCDILAYRTAGQTSRKQLFNHQSFPHFIHSSVYRVLILVRPTAARAGHQLSMLQHSDGTGNTPINILPHTCWAQLCLTPYLLQASVCNHPLHMKRSCQPSTLALMLCVLTMQVKNLFFLLNVITELRSSKKTAFIFSVDSGNTQNFSFAFNPSRLDTLWNLLKLRFFFTVAFIIMSTWQIRYLLSVYPF